MKHLGQVFRFFREARHISLSEATGGEFSKSMLSRFENGQSELSAQKLFSALNAIHTETEEFTVAAGIQDHHSHKELLSQIQDLLQANQLDLLEELYLKKEKITQKSKKASDWVELLIVKAYLCVLKESEKACPGELDFLHDYLFSVDIWGALRAQSLLCLHSGFISRFVFPVHQRNPLKKGFCYLVCQQSQHPVHYFS